MVSKCPTTLLKRSSDVFLLSLQYRCVIASKSFKTSSSRLKLFVTTLVLCYYSFERRRGKEVSLPHKKNKPRKEISMKKHTIELTKEQREALEHLVKKGNAPARKILHAQVMLKIESGEEGPNWSDQQVKEAFGVGGA